MSPTVASKKQKTQTTKYKWKSGPPFRSQKSSQMAAPICFLFFQIFSLLFMRYQHRLVSGTSDCPSICLSVLSLPCSVVVSNSFGKLIKIYTVCKRYKNNTQMCTAIHSCSDSSKDSEERRNNNRRQIEIWADISFINSRI